MRCSLIIPAFNAEKSIKKCLESALNQSLPRDEYEIIVIDDGSTDQTAQIVTGYPVKCIRQKNQGPAVARNHGAHEAKGDIVVFTDSDCELDSGFLQALIAPIEGNPEIVGSQGSYKTRQTEFMAQFGQLEIETRYKRMQKNPYIDFIGTYAAAYRRDVFLEFGGFDTEFPLASGEDAEFSYRLAQKGHKMVFVPEAFVYHTHPDSLKKYLRVKFWRAYWRILAYRKNPEKALKDSYTPQTLKVQILLVGLLGILLLSIPFLGVALSGSLFLTALFLFGVSCLSFVKMAWQRDAVLGLLSPLVLLVRALTFLSGNLCGLISEVFKKRREDR